MLLETLSPGQRAAFLLREVYGDPGALEELLAHDVTLHGGGLPQPLEGRVRVARTLLAGVRTATTRFGGHGHRGRQEPLPGTSRRHHTGG